MQYGEVMTNSDCVAIAPRMREEIEGEDGARAWYADSWFVLSLSHSALMSPVTMKVWRPDQWEFAFLV